MSWQDAVLNLSSILSHAPGAPTEVVGEGLLTADEAVQREYGIQLVEPMRWELTVRSTGGDDDYIVEGSIAGAAIIECRRCLKPVTAEASGSFVFPMVYDPAQDASLTLVESEEEDELLSFGQPSVDFGPLLAQMFAIELPLTVLCKDACRGLSIDGVDLNVHPDHEPPRREAEEPSPFEVLKDLEL